MFTLRGSKMAKMSHSKEMNLSVSGIKAVSTEMGHKAVKSFSPQITSFIHSFSEDLLSACQGAGEDHEFTKPYHGAFYVNNAQTQALGLN